MKENKLLILNLNNIKWSSIFFLALLFLGGYLRLYHLDDKLLWQDEAETALYARQILNFQLPNAYDKERGLFLYIGVLIPFSNTPTDSGQIDPYIYGFYQEDFTNDGRLVKHPYGDILLTAYSFAILGVSTFSARFPFALLGIFSLILTYKLSQFLYHRRIALMAMAFQAFNIVLIGYERQTRYYSLSVFCFLGVTYYALKAFHQSRLKDCILASLFYIMLFYSAPQAAIALVIILLFYNLYNQRSWQWLSNRTFVLSLFLIAFFISPYLFLCQPWKVLHTPIEELSLFTKYFRTGAYLIGLSTNMPFYLIFIGLLFMLWKRTPSDIFTIITLLIPPLVFPLFIISSSFYERIYLFLIPFLSLATARSIDFLYSLIQERVRKPIGYLLIFSLLFVGLFFPKNLSYGIDRHLSQYPFSLQRWPKVIPTFYKFITGIDSFGFLTGGQKDTQWVREAIAFLQNRRIGKGEWVFTTFQSTTLLFYTDFKAQLIWPIKESYLNSIKERFWILIDPVEVREEESMCDFFHGRFNPPSNERIKERNYKDRIKECKKYILPSSAIVYECSPY